MDVFVGDVAFEIQVQQVLPFFPFDGAGLDFDQVDVVPREMTQQLEQRAGLIVQREHHADFVAVRIRLKILADDDEAGRVFALILDALRQNGEAMDLGGPSAGDGALVRITGVLHHFRAVGCAVERNLTPLLMVLEIIGGLLETLRVRIDFLDLIQTGPFQADQMLLDFDVLLAHDGKAVFVQQIEHL